MCRRSPGSTRRKVFSSETTVRLSRQRGGQKEDSMNQLERLNYLVEQFKEDSGQYRGLVTPVDSESKKRLLQ